MGQAEAWITSMERTRQPWACGAGGILSAISHLTSLAFGFLLYEWVGLDLMSFKMSPCLMVGDKELNVYQFLQ